MQWTTIVMIVFVALMLLFMIGQLLAQIIHFKQMPTLEDASKDVKNAKTKSKY